VKGSINKVLRFSRLVKLIGEENVRMLGQRTVLVLGCGGVGSYVCEALVRSGIGKIIIVDFDSVDETNINRQLIALDSTIGKLKVDVLEKRIKDINPLCHVKKIKEFINKDNLDKLFENKIDFFVDACDTISTKKEIINKCLSKKIKLISSMGTGNKLDPSKLSIVDIRKTQNDPLARIIRKHIKDSGIKDKIMVLSSTEVPIKTGDKTPASISFVPSVAGLLIAGYVIRNLLNMETKNK